MSACKQLQIANGNLIRVCFYQSLKFNISYYVRKYLKIFLKLI